MAIYAIGRETVTYWIPVIHLDGSNPMLSHETVAGLAGRGARHRTRWRHHMIKLSALLTVCEGNHWLSVDSPHKGANNAELWCFLYCWCKQAFGLEWKFEASSRSRELHASGKIALMVFLQQQIPSITCWGYMSLYWTFDGIWSQFRINLSCLIFVRSMYRILFLRYLCRWCISVIV